jgi:sortase A
VTTTQTSGDIVDLRERDADHTEVVVAPPVGAGVVAPSPSSGARAPLSSATRTDTASVVSQGLATFSFLVLAMILFLFVFSGFAEARSQVSLRRRFESETAQLRAPIGGSITTGVPVAELDIAAIGVHQIVVQGTTSGTLRAGPGHLRQSPLPGQEGNSVIFGRRSAYGGVFRHIAALDPGTNIRVTTGEGHFTYVVDAVHTLKQSDGSELVDAGTDQLTLVTSDPAFFASRRLVVSAHLIGEPFAPSADATAVTRAELGLAGETSAVLLLVLWLEALLIVAIGATWLWRRWTRWSAYLVSVPVLITVTWLAFENLARLLPATL